jgi:hypothetical protein
VWALIDQERGALLEELAALELVQWDSPSLCADWRVRDVVGYLVFAVNSGWQDLALGIVKHRGSLDRDLSAAAIQAGDASPATCSASSQPRSDHAICRPS